ncbi:MAG: YfiR family protein, partial [Alphaproteobacteria bacterium]
MLKNLFCKHGGCLKKFIVVMFLFTFLTVGLTGILLAASYKDSQVKAVYLFNFINYVKWPVESTSTNLCVVGSDPVGFSLALVAEKSSGDYGNIEVEKRSYNSRLDDCHIVFIGDAVKDRLGKILYALEKLP